jgi:polyhydroxyalkanoate synthesis regulator phasin
MSMHELEDTVESFIRIIANSNVPVLRKRILIHKMFEIESYGDCGFTNLRTIDEMVACKYSFLFEKEQMYDYNERKEFYDNIEHAPPHKDGDVYAYWNGEHFEKRVCVDSNTKAWEEMVERGLITGEGAVALEDMNFIEALKEVMDILKNKMRKEILEIMSPEEIEKMRNISSEKEYEEKIEALGQKKYMIFQQRSYDHINGLYLCAVITGIDEEMNEEEYLQIFGMDREKLEDMLGI